MSPPKVLMWEDDRPHTGPVAIEGIGVQMSVLQELEYRTMKIIGAVLGDDVDDAAERPAVLGVVVGVLYPELAGGFGSGDVRSGRLAWYKLVTPSTRISLVLGRPPLTAMLDDPAISNGRSRVADAFSVTPGADQAWAMMLRPCSAVFSTRFDSTVRPRSADSVSRTSAPAETVMLWFTSPRVSFRSATARWATSKLQRLGAPPV